MCCSEMLVVVVVMLASNETPMEKESCSRLTLIMLNMLRGGDCSRAAVLDIFQDDASRFWMSELDAEMQ